MGPLAIVLGRIFSHAMGALALKIFAALGVGFVTYQGADLILSALESQIVVLTGTLPDSVKQMASVLRIDDAMKVFFSAVAVRITLRGVGVASGSVKRLALGL